MNAGKQIKITKYFATALLVILPAVVCAGGGVRELLNEGNSLYARQEYNEAINKYDQVLVEDPQALEPVFNKADSFYRLDDLDKAMELYRQAASESKDMKLVTAAKYNLGNSVFGQGMKQRDSDPQKAIDDLKEAIGYWRAVLDIDPANENAAKNIEVARLTIKDIIDQINKQPKDPNEPGSGQQQQGDEGSQDPNQASDQQEQQQAKDPNQASDQQEQQQAQQQEQEGEEQTEPPDATAQEILDKEQEQQKMRQILQRGRWQKVEKDW